jgi:predicted nucleic acid-binding protein
MSGVDFLVDTNVLIYALEGHPAVSGIIQCSVGLSVISEMELLGKKGIRPHEIFAIRHLLNDCNIMKLTDEIKDVAIVLKQAYTLKIPDAIVAATAIHWELSLVTADSDFKNIKELDLVRLTLS